MELTDLSYHELGRSRGWFRASSTEASSVVAGSNPHRSEAGSALRGRAAPALVTRQEGVRVPQAALIDGPREIQIQGIGLALREAMLRASVVVPTWRGPSRTTAVITRELRAQTRDRIIEAIFLQFLFRSVTCRIRHRVAPITIGSRFQECRVRLFADRIHDLGNLVAHFAKVHSIDDFSRDIVPFGAIDDLLE